MMRYFTPELFMQFNSFDPEEAERADEAWDKAETAYKEQVERIREAWPESVRKLSSLCLHDTDVLSREEQFVLMEPFPEGPGAFRHTYPFWTAIAGVSVRQGDEILTLFYVLADRMKVREAPDGWRFSRLREHWLYDEVDFLCDNHGPFVHRILLSTGVTLEIPFTGVGFHKIPLPLTTGESHGKQSA
jgi:hypothetical protein